MKKQLRSAVLLLLIAAAIWLLLDSSVRDAVGAGLALCARSVIPAQFPFMVVSSMLMSMGLGELLSKPLGALMALYGIDGAGASAVVLGFLGGYPTGARTAGELYRDRLLTREETLRLLTFCNNANPAFLITVLGLGIFGSVRAGLWLWLIHVAAALITGLLAGRPKKNTGAVPGNHRRPAFKAARLPDAFVGAVQSALRGILNVCAFVVIFCVLTLPCQSIGGVPGAVLSGLLELFSTLPAIPASPTGFILAAGLSGWGGLSVLCQTAALLRDTDLSIGQCAAGKAVHGALSSLLAALCSGFVFG